MEGTGWDDSLCVGHPREQGIKTVAPTLAVIISALRPQAHWLFHILFHKKPFSVNTLFHFIAASFIQGIATGCLLFGFPVGSSDKVSALIWDNTGNKQISKQDPIG